MGSSAWTSQEALTLLVAGHIGEVVSNVLVVAAGQMASQAVTDLAYSVVLESDGSPGPCVAVGSVGHPPMHAGSFVRGSAIYVMGGFDDPSVWDDAVMATVQSDGTVSPWTAAGMLPGPMSHFSVSFVDGYVYLAGELAMSAFDNPPELAAAWRASLATDGTLTGWTAMTPLSVANAVHGRASSHPVGAARYWPRTCVGGVALGAIAGADTSPIVGSKTSGAVAEADADGVGVAGIGSPMVGWGLPIVPHAAIVIGSAAAAATSAICLARTSSVGAIGPC